MRKPSMKTISITVSIVVFTILTAAVVIILNFTKPQLKIDKLGEPTKVGLVLIGAADDKSWNSTHYESLSRISEELNLEIECRENVPDDERCLPVMRSLADQGCLVIIADSFGYGEYVETVAAEYPDVYFMHATGTASGKNICSFFGRMYQFRYLSGIVAGLQTSTDSIGYVAAFPISEVNRGINAFTLGVRSVNPDAAVHVLFCDSWTEDEPAYDCTRRLIDEFGADVIAMHTDSLAPLKASEEAGVWSVGYNQDNSADFPGSFLTACVWKWDGYYKEQIKLCLQGKFRGEHSWLGIESGIMELADPEASGNALPGYKIPLDKAKERFEKFEFDVFYGPVKDNTGRVRIAEGESMSDLYMLEKFDWYVEGVEIES